METFKGYRNDFLGGTFTVKLPILSNTQLKDLAINPKLKKGELTYYYYSSFVSKSRRFPFFTASNINGALFHEIKREEIFPSGNDDWKEDLRIGEFQWGNKLYDAPQSNFDRGHLTKREDTQWGLTKENAKLAAQDTFYFPNCVPQLLELNQRKWRNLEDYILKKQAVPQKRQICVFTGPILAQSDPYFITEIKGNRVQIPVLFWKIVYYINEQKKLSRVGFLMGQEKLLKERKLVIDGKIKPSQPINELKASFVDFKDAETYQVNVATIEKLSSLTFNKANDPYTDSRPLKIIMDKIQVNENMLNKNSSQSLGYQNVQL